MELTGVYIITYSVTDNEGNGADPAECPNSYQYKTVTVEDTLKPLISLVYKGSDLMAETSSSSSFVNVNGWAIGAVASAISGVALLGYAATRRKKAVAASVPV